MVASLPQLQLIDGQQRRIRKLRLSLTDRCNLRCTYCMPTDATFMSPQHYLTAAEYARIVAELVRAPPAARVPGNLGSISGSGGAGFELDDEWGEALALSRTAGNLWGAAAEH